MTMPVPGTDRFPRLLRWRFVVYVWMLAVILAFLYPHLPKAREDGRLTACGHQLRSIGTCFSMYAMGWDEQFPPRPEAMVPDQIADIMIFRCKSNSGDPMGYIYLPGLNANCPRDCLMMFDKRCNHWQKRNALYLDASWKTLSEDDFQKEAARMLGPEYRKYYAPEAIARLEDMVAGRETDTNPWRLDYLIRYGEIMIALGAVVLSALIVMLQRWYDRRKAKSQVCA
ncbi:MAG: hypothetical protein ABIF71_05085 [Planctomycetota bacterium]